MNLDQQENMKIDFDAPGISPGVYLLKMEAGSYANTKKMILLR